MKALSEGSSQLIRTSELAITKTDHLKIWLVGDSLHKGWTNYQLPWFCTTHKQRMFYQVTMDLGGLTLQEVWRVHLEQFCFNTYFGDFFDLSFFLGAFWECSFAVGKKSFFQAQSWLGSHLGAPLGLGCLQQPGREARRQLDWIQNRR